MKLKTESKSKSPVPFLLQSFGLPQEEDNPHYNSQVKPRSKKTENFNHYEMDGDSHMKFMSQTSRKSLEVD